MQKLEILASFLPSIANILLKYGNKRKFQLYRNQRFQLILIGNQFQ